MNTYEYIYIHIYIKHLTRINFSQIAEMQMAREETPKLRHSISSPPLGCREVPRKHYLKKELSIMSEDNIAWQSVPEVCSVIRFDNSKCLHIRITT